MIKKILLTSAALLSMTGAWAVDHDGITYSVSSSNIEDNSVKKTTTEKEENGNKVNITEKIRWSGKISNIYIVTPTDLGDETVVTLGMWTETLPNTNMESESDPEKYNYEINADKYSELATEQGYALSMAFLRYMNYQVNLSGYVLNANECDDEKYDNLVAYPGTMKHPVTGKVSSVYFCIEDFTYKRDIAGYKENENVYKVESFNASLINSKITSLTIGSTVTSHTGNFGNALGLVSISSNSSAYEVVNEDKNVFLYNAGKTVLLYTSASGKTITLPETVTSIAPGAIINSQNLVIKASGITGNPTLEGTNNRLHKNEAIVNGNAVTGFINQAAFDAISFESGKSYDFSEATIESDITVSSLPTNTILFFTKGKSDTWNIDGDNVVINSQCSNLVLADGVAYNNTISDFTAATATYTRTLSAEKWGTLVIPFESQNTDMNITAAELTNVANNQLFFTTTGTIRANAPVMLYSATAQDAAFTSNSVTVKKSTPTVGYTIANKSSQFVGTYSLLTIEEGNGFTYYGYYPSREQFLKMGTGKTVGAFRGCIKASASDMNAAEAPAFRLIDEFSGAIEDITASVTDIDIVTTGETVDKVYSLDGKYANEKERSAIYVKNGKKFINK